MIKSAMTKKEIAEIFKTYRWWVIPVVFLFFAFSAPASVKFLPELLKGQLEAQNIKITFPEPGPIEALAEYFNSLGQMGMLAVILLSMGLISDERSKGVLAQVLVKPASKASIVMSKFLVHGSYLLISLLLSATGCFVYTIAIFGGTPVGEFAVAVSAYSLYILLIFTVTLFFSSVVRSQIAAGGFALLSFFVLSLIPAIGQTFSTYSPAALSGFAVNTIQRKPVDDITAAVMVTVLMIAVLLTAAISIFNKQEL